MLNMDGNRRFGIKVLASGLALGVGFMLMSLTGWRDRDYKPVSDVKLQSLSDGKSIESLSSSKTPPPSGGAYGLDMTGKIHDGYLELRIKNELKNETMIFPMSRVLEVTFAEPN